MESASTKNSQPFEVQRTLNFVSAPERTGWSVLKLNRHLALRPLGLLSGGFPTGTHIIAPTLQRLGCRKGRAG